MDNRLTQRLVGAGVIAALAVIFVPEILNKRDKSSIEKATVIRPPSLQAPPKSEQPALTFSQTPAPAPVAASPCLLYTSPSPRD